jgi:hypothetical protein
MKKNEVILSAGNEKLVFSENSETMGARLPNESGLFEFEKGTSKDRYPDYKEFGKFTGERAEPKKTVNFAGPLRHLFLSTNYRHSVKGATKKGALPTEYAALYPITKLASEVRKEKDSTEPGKIYVQANKLDEFLAKVKEMQIPDDWRDFCIQTSVTAKSELKGKPAKSKTTPKTKSEPAKSNDNNAQILGEKVIEKFGTWELIDEKGMEKLLAGIKAYKTTLTAVRKYVDSNQPEQEEETAEDFEF